MVPNSLSKNRGPHQTTGRLSYLEALFLEVLNKNSSLFYSKKSVLNDSLLVRLGILFRK